MICLSCWKQVHNLFKLKLKAKAIIEQEFNEIIHEHFVSYSRAKFVKNGV
jgi:hypothetical protein